jgi:hypothetical protein
MPCAFPSCERQAIAHGLCAAHYYQARNGLDLRPIRPKRYDGRECSVEGCRRPAKSNGLCYTHWMAARRRVTNAIKLERGCADCGYCEHAEALEFHHVDPAGKDYIVGAMAGWRLDRVLAEVDKCEVLCANCHRIRHAVQRGQRS